MENTGNKPKLFLYSLILPTIWFTFGWINLLVAPGRRLGIPGLVMVMITATIGMSWLLARKYQRQFTSEETWKLIGYCFVWAFFCEFFGILYAVSFPEETGLNIDAQTAIVGITIGAAVNFLFVWAALKRLSPRFINWYLKKIDSKKSIKRTGSPIDRSSENM